MTPPPSKSLIVRVLKESIQTITETVKVFVAVEVFVDEAAEAGTVDYILRNV